MKNFKRELRKDLIVNILRLFGVSYLAWLCIDAKFWLGLVIPAIGFWYFLADSYLIIKAHLRGA